MTSYLKSSNGVITNEEIARVGYDKNHHAFPYLFSKYEKFYNDTEEKIPDKREVIDKMVCVKEDRCEYIYGFFFEDPRKMYYCLAMNDDGTLVFMEEREWATMVANALGMQRVISKQDRVLEKIAELRNA